MRVGVHPSLDGGHGGVPDPGCRRYVPEGVDGDFDFLHDLVPRHAEHLLWPGVPLALVDGGRLPLEIFNGPSGVGGDERGLQEGALDDQVGVALVHLDAAEVLEQHPRVGMGDVGLGGVLAALDVGHGEPGVVEGVGRAEAEEHQEGGGKHRAQPVVGE